MKCMRLIKQQHKPTHQQLKQLQQSPTLTQLQHQHQQHNLNNFNLITTQQFI